MPQGLVNSDVKSVASPRAGRGVAAILGEMLCWGVLALGLSYFVATVDWVGTAMVMGIMAAGVLLLTDPKLVMMLWMVGQPTFFVFVNNMAAEIPLFTTERALFMLLFGLMIAKAVFRDGPGRQFSTVEKVVIGIVTLICLSFAATLPGKNFATVRQDLALLVQCYAMPLITVLIAGRLEWSERDIQLLLHLLTGTGLFLVVVGTMQFFFGVTMFVPRYLEVIHEGRTKGTFANAVEYGSVVAAAVVLALSQYAGARDPLFRAALVILIGAMLGAVAISFSRSPLVGLAAALLFVFLHDRRVRPLLTIGGLVGAVGTALAAPLFFDLDGFLARLQEIEPIYNRIALLATAGQMILAHPLMGVGFGRYAFSDNKYEYLSGFGSVSGQWAADIGIPHQEYIHIAVLTGLPGVALYVAALWMMLRTLRVALASQANPPFVRTVALYSAAILISLLVNGLFVDFIAYNYFTTLTYFLVGVVSSFSARRAAPGYSPGQGHRAAASRSAAGGRGGGRGARPRMRADPSSIPGRTVRP